MLGKYVIGINEILQSKHVHKNPGKNVTYVEISDASVRSDTALFTVVLSLDIVCCESQALFGVWDYVSGG